MSTIEIIEAQLLFIYLRRKDLDMFTLIKLLFELMFLPLKIMMWAVKKVFWILLIGIGFFI